MGWLRKVGRKISKKLGKIFGSKLGAVVGAVGLYMLMGPVAKGLTGWAKSAFGIDLIFAFSPSQYQKGLEKIIKIH